MNLSEYKKSGILEAYVLGVLDPERTQLLEKDLETNVALRKELNLIQQSLSNFKENFTRDSSGPSEKRDLSKKSPARSSGKKGGIATKVIGFIMVFAIAVLVFLFLSTMYQSTAYQQAAQERLDRIGQMESQIGELEDRMQVLENGLLNSINSDNVSLLNDPGNNPIKSTGWWVDVPQSNSELLIIQNLPHLEGEEYFQLWGQLNHEFRRMGTLQANSNPDHSSPFVHILPQSNIQFAMITIEKGENPGQPGENKVLIKKP